MILLPFMFFRYIFDKINNSRKTWSLIWGILTTLLFLFIVNLIIMNVSGNPLYDVNADLDMFQKGKQFISNALPLHGFVSLIKYLISLAL